MEESIRIILETVQRAKGELDATLKQIQKLSEGTKQHASASERANAIIQKHRTSLLALGVAALAVQTAMVLLIKGQIELGDSLNALSQKSGVSVENLSTLAHVAKNANIEFGSFATGLKFLNKAMVDSATPGSDAAQAFAALGVNAKDANGKIKESSGFMLELADAFARYKDDANKSTVASQIFGRDGLSWIPLLNKGSVAIKEEQAQVRALGGEMSGKFAKDADAFNDSIHNIGIIMRGAALQVITAMLPALQKLAELVIENKNVVVPVFIALAGAVTLASTAFAVFKAATLIAAISKLALLMPALAAQFGITATATAAAGTAAGVATVSFAPLVLAIVALSLALATGVEAWRLYNAAMGENKAAASLGEQTSKITTFLQKQIDLAKEAGRVTEDEARKLKIQLGRGQAGGLDAQIAANRKVMDAIRGKTSEELKFNAAAMESAKSTAAQVGGGDKPGLVVPEAPKVVSDRALAIASAQSKGTGLEADLIESKARVQLAGETSAQLAQITQLRFEAQSIEQFAAVQDLEAQKAQGLISEAQYQAELSAINKAGEVERQNIRNKAAEATAATRDKQLQGTQTMFSNMAIAAKTFGKEGFIAYKIFASAAAVVDTYRGATAAYAAMAGIPYVGPVLGIIAAAAAIAAGLANVAAINAISFAGGGLVPGAPSSRDNRIANVATGEYIFDARSVARVGPGYMAALHQSIIDGSFVRGFAGGGLVPRPVMTSSFAGGGLVGSATAKTEADGAQSFNFGFVDSRNQQREFTRKEGVRILIDAMQKRGNKVFG